MKYNQNTRMKNAALASSAGVIQQLVQVAGNFIYRTIFLSVLTTEYLGLNGLFANVLQMLSLAELGLGSVLLYSMYKPFAQQDTQRIRNLVAFYKKVYLLITLVIGLLGICAYPFMGKLVDLSEVPPDISLRKVYFLFLVQSLTNYAFAYRRAVLTANQQQHVIFFYRSAVLAAGYVVRIVVLLIRRDYETQLLLGVAAEFLMEWLFFLWIGRVYGDLFRGAQPLDREDRLEIYRKTGGLLCHKVGELVVSSTDSIVLARYAGLAAVGLYANYQIITMAISNVFVRVFSGIIPGVANFSATRDPEQRKVLFFRVLFLNMWVVSFCTVCLWLLLNPFIQLWLGESFLFPEYVVMAICMQQYLQMSSQTANVFINGCGLFAKDKLRPLLESAVNLAVSIYLAKRVGVVGVFIGTCVSAALTYVWRQPYLVIRHAIGSGHGRYWLVQLAWLGITVLMCAAGSWLFRGLPDSLPGFLLKMAVAGLGSNLVLLGLTFPTADFRYYREIVSSRLAGLGKKHR